MTTALIVLAILVVLAGIVVGLGHLRIGTETYTLSTRDFPNVASGLDPASGGTVART